MKAIAAALLSAVLIIVLRSSAKGIGELLTILLCCILAFAALQYVGPVLEFVCKLEHIADMGMVKTLLKIVGISVIAEIASLICQDAGSSAMGKSLQLLAAAVTLYLSLPLITKLMDLIEGIMDKL